MGLYTRSTLEAGVAIAESGGTNDKGESAAAAEGRLSSYLLCIAEVPYDASGSGAAAAGCGGDGGGDGGGGGPSSSSSSSSRVRIGVAAVDTSTGDVMHGEFEDGAMRPELEARLLRVAPAEVLLVEPLSAATSKLVNAMYGGGGSGGGGGGGGAGAGVRVERVAASSGYVDGGAAAAVAAAVAEVETTRRREESAAAEAAAEAQGNGDRSAAAAAAAAASSSSVTGAALNLPGQTLRAVAVSFDWLRQFGLGGMLRLAPTFRPLSETNEMALSPNVIRQLELLRSGDGAHRGSLLWLMGSNTVTAAGGRLMRRWVAHPLTDRASIEARLEAVAELRDEGEEQCGGKLDGLNRALRRAHG